MKKIYIAGKVTGLPYDEVERKFNKYRKVLLAQGYEVIVPLDLCDKDDDWHIAMRKCIAALCTCDEIHLLQDWNDSEGAYLEHSIAIRLEIKIVYVKDTYYRPECSAIYCDSPNICRTLECCRYQ